MASNSLRVYHNTKRRSEYNEQAEGGFAFRKLPRLCLASESGTPSTTTSACDPKNVEPSSQANAAASVQHSARNRVRGRPSLQAKTATPRPAIPPPDDRSRSREVESSVAGRGASGPSRFMTDDHHQPDDHEEISEGFSSSEEAEMRKEVEVIRFVSKLRKDLLDSGVNCSEKEMDEVMEQLTSDLCSTDTYFQYLDEDERESNKYLMFLKKAISNLKEKARMYSRELALWETAIERKVAEVEQWKSDIEGERDVDFLCLRSDDVEILRSYLTPQQTEVLDSEVPYDAQFHSSGASRLQRAQAAIDKELDRIQTYCASLLKRVSVETEKYHPATVEQTPRTIVHAMQQCQ